MGRYGSGEEMREGAILPATEVRREHLASRGAKVGPAWLAFIRYCQQLKHGEIEKLKIQDGLPVLAEQAIKRIKF